MVSLAHLQPCTIDWDLIGQMGERERLESLINARWRRLLDIQGAQYMELTLEFQATFQHRARTFDVDTALSFSLGGRLHSMSVSTFAMHAGLYTAEEVTLPIFTESLRGVSPPGQPPNFYIMTEQLKVFWTTIADDTFVSMTPLSHIRGMMFRFIHRVIACTVVGRHMGIEKVATTDVFILYSMIEREPTNLASILITSILLHHRSRGQQARVALGPYVRMIAESLSVFDKYPAERPTAGPVFAHIRYDGLQQMGLCPIDGPRRFVEPRVMLQAAIPQEQTRHRFDRWGSSSLARLLGRNL